MKPMLISVLSVFALALVFQDVAEAQNQKGNRQSGNNGRGGSSRQGTIPPTNNGGSTAKGGSTNQGGGSPKTSTTKTGSDGKGATNNGSIIVQGGAGGNASGPGSKGGAGGDAILVMGNNNTVINGNVTYVLGSTGRKSGSGGGGGSGRISTGVTTSGWTSAETGILTGASVIAGTNGTASQTTERADTEDTPEKPPVEQTERYLELDNQSGEKLQVSLQFRTLGADNKWQWVPADPATSEKAMAFDMEPGQKGFVKRDGQKITASRVRLWSQSATGKWLEFKDEDLWLVPEKNKAGTHRYLADEIKSFTFVFPKPGGK